MILDNLAPMGTSKPLHTSNIPIQPSFCSQIRSYALSDSRREGCPAQRPAVWASAIRPVVPHPVLRLRLISISVGLLPYINK
jgi:hypothetical protein